MPVTSRILVFSLYFLGESLTHYTLSITSSINLRAQQGKFDREYSSSIPRIHCDILN